MSINVRIKLIGDGAVAPSRATNGSAGYDLCARIPSEDGLLEIPPGEVRKIPVGIAVELPLDMAGMVYPRSGLSSRERISLANGVGVIDSDFRGEIEVPLQNLSDRVYTVQHGMRVAQLVFTPIVTPALSIVPKGEDLSDTSRGVAGYGSTGGF